MDEQEKQPILSWQAQEHREIPRSQKWYWYVGIAIIIIAGISVYFSNFIFAIIVVVGGVLLMFFAHTNPDTIHITIDRGGVRVDNKLYPYKNLKQFSIINKPQLNEYRLLVITSDKLGRLLNLPIDSEVIDPEEIHKALEEFVEFNEDLQETISDQIAERIGF